MVSGHVVSDFLLAVKLQLQFAQHSNFHSISITELSTETTSYLTTLA
jgi:hypothetical protein